METEGRTDTAESSSSASQDTNDSSSATTSEAEDTANSIVTNPGTFGYVTNRQSKTAHIGYGNAAMWRNACGSNRGANSVFLDSEPDPGTYRRCTRQACKARFPP